MNPPDGLTVFQTRVRSMLNTVLPDLGIEAEFEYVKRTGEVPGAARPGEHYVRAAGQVRGHLIEVFVYSDEIGFFCDRSWRIFESQDFRDESTLLETALRELKACISDL